MGERWLPVTGVVGIIGVTVLGAMSRVSGGEAIVAILALAGVIGAGHVFARKNGPPSGSEPRPRPPGI